MTNLCWKIPSSTADDCTETEYHEHNGLTYKPILNVCTREDCGDAGVHMHDGVYYRGWTDQPVTGPIGNPNDARQDQQVTEPLLPSTSGHHSESHHSGGHH